MRVIGLGLSSTATVAEVAHALSAAGSADGIAILSARAGHPALAEALLPLLPLPESAVRGVATPTQSLRIVARFGCGSVAEALALVASDGTLVTTRETCGGATWAVAETNPPAARKDQAT